MKKFIVLICSLVLVFSLIIPVSAEEPLYVQQAKEFDYSIAILNDYGDGSYYLTTFEYPEGVIPTYEYTDTQYGRAIKLNNGVQALVKGYGYYDVWELEEEYYYTDLAIVFGENDIILIPSEEQEPEQPLTEIQLLERNNEILTHIYTAILFSVSIACVSFVVFLLYKFLRKFF